MIRLLIFVLVFSVSGIFLHPTNALAAAAAGRPAVTAASAADCVPGV